MLKKLLAEVPAGFLFFILYVGALNAMVGAWLMGMITGS